MSGGMRLTWVYFVKSDAMDNTMLCVAELAQCIDSQVALEAGHSTNWENLAQKFDTIQGCLHFIHSKAYTHTDS